MGETGNAPSGPDGTGPAGGWQARYGGDLTRRGLWLTITEYAHETGEPVKRPYRWSVLADPWPSGAEAGL